MSEEKHVKQMIGVKHVPPIVFNLFSSKMLRTTPTEDDKIDNVCVCVCGKKERKPQITSVYVCVPWSQPRNTMMWIYPDTYQSLRIIEYHPVFHQWIGCPHHVCHYSGLIIPCFISGCLFPSYCSFSTHFFWHKKIKIFFFTFQNHKLLLPS